MIFKYSSIEEAITAYNTLVSELESTIKDYETKTSGIATNGEAWGGNAATASNQVIGIIKSWIQKLKNVTHEDTERIDTVKNNNMNAEHEIKTIYNKD